MNTDLTNAAPNWLWRFNNYFKLNLNMLITLGLVCQHSFLIKIIAVLALTFLNLKSLQQFKLKKIPLFYFLIICIELLKFAFFNESYGLPHFAQFTVGIIYWVFSLFICWIIYYTIQTQEHVRRTINLITILNFTFSLFQYIQICIIEHTINPYNTGHNHPYGISTGDLINGLFHGVHLTNAFVSLFLVIYHLHNKKYWLTACSLCCLLLTGNNYATIVLLFISAIYFIINRKKSNLLAIGITTFLVLIFYVAITPLNAEYLLQKVLHVTATLPNSARDLANEDKNSKSGFTELNIADTINPYDIEGKTAKKIIIKSSGRDTVFDFVKQSGKIRSYYQTKDYLTSSVPHFLFGSGLGGYSSKLAFNSSGVMEGSKLNKILPRYETNDFKNNHKALYKYLKTQHIMFHSESNRPFSVYNQLLGEYGFVGFILFFVTYIWFFIKRIRLTSFALPCLIALLFILNIDYFIESLSVLLFFETFMFLDIKEKQNENAV